MVNRAKRPDRQYLLAAARHPKRRDGAIAIALFLLPWVAALVLVDRHHHLDGGTMAILVAVSLGLPTLWVTWAAYRGPRRPADLSMAQVADQLAIAVGAQWSAEAAVRRLNDPYPLPVSWTVADPSLTDAWDSLVRLATSGAGWPPPPPGGTWAAGPDDLAGEDGELADVLARVPTGRLVVLGEPGAGKTMLMVRLLLDLLARRAEGGPVPILASVASWNPAAQDLRGWLGAQLVIDYPALAYPPPDGMTEPTQAAALLASGLILPVLDGLDEIPEQARGPAISRINNAQRTGEQMVVTCRTEQYKDAIWPQGGVRTTVTEAAAVQLCPLDADAVSDYLCETGGPDAAKRWHSVLTALGTQEPVGQVLSTPLMIALARTIYNPRAGEVTGELRDPAELCKLGDRAAVEAQLLDAFIRAAYRPQEESRRRHRWIAAQAEQWLIFLARDLQRRRTTDLNWWEIHSAAPRSLAGLSVGLIAGLAGAFGLVNGAGVGIGLITAVTVVLIVRRWIGPPAGLARGLTGGLIGGAAGALAVHAVIGASLGPALAGGLADGVAAGYLGGFRAGLAGGFAGGFVGILVGHPDLRYVGRLINGLGAGLVAGCIVGLAQRSSPARELRWSPIGFILGLGAGLILGFAVWLQAGLGGALIAGLAGTVGVGFAAGLEAASADAAEAANPRAVAARDRATFWKTGLAAGLAIGLTTGFAVGFTSGFTQGIGVGLASAVAVTLAAGFRQASWGQFTVARWWLAIRGRLPWHLMGFLAEAHRRGVLRQAGAAYQFRHIELQHRLANRAAPARIGSYVDVQDVSGGTYRVTLVKVIDPAQGADQFTSPDSGKRFVAAVFRIKALVGSPQDEDANIDAVIVGSNGQSCTADFAGIAGYTNFYSGTINVAQGDTVTGSVTFQVPDGVTVAKVQWRPGAFGSAVQWEVRR